jgi:hypothetical protein
MNATIQLTQINSEDTAAVIGSRDALISLLHRAFNEVPMFKSICTEALLTFDTEAAGKMSHNEYSFEAEKTIKATFKVFDQFEIPSEYPYFAVNFQGFGIAFRQEPVRTDFGWLSNSGTDIGLVDTDEGYIVGYDFDEEGWAESLLYRNPK